MQYFCERIQMLCKKRQRFSGEHKCFVRERKCSRSHIVSVTKLLRANAKFLWEMQKNALKYHICSHLINCYNVRDAHIIFKMAYVSNTYLFNFPSDQLLGFSLDGVRGITLLLHEIRKTSES